MQTLKSLGLFTLHGVQIAVVQIADHVANLKDSSERAETETIAQQASLCAKEYFQFVRDFRLAVSAPLTMWLTEVAGYQMAYRPEQLEVKAPLPRNYQQIRSMVLPWWPAGKSFVRNCVEDKVT